MRVLIEKKVELDDEEELTAFELARFTPVQDNSVSVEISGLPDPIHTFSSFDHGYSAIHFHRQGNAQIPPFPGLPKWPHHDVVSRRASGR